MRRFGGGALCLVLILSAFGCTGYERFTLPVATADSPPVEVRWEWEVRPEPVALQGATWDSVDALNPSVVPVNGLLWNYYSGYDGAVWHTGVSSSRDGIEWSGRRRVLSPEPSTWEGDYIAANGSALLHGGRIWYWYQAGGRRPKIGLAQGNPGEDLVKHPDPVLDWGPRGSWDEKGVADPYVIRLGDWFYLYYLGQDRARRQRLGVARSKDGVEWEKLVSNPILEPGELGAFDEMGLGEPAVWQDLKGYWMLYTGRDRQEWRRLGLAWSADGVEWRRVTQAPVLEGSQDWMRQVVCDPTVIENGDRIRVWFGGGNRPSPDENLNGQIGYAELRMRPERELP